MTKQKQDIAYKEYLNLKRQHENLKGLGVQFIKSRSILKSIAGVSLISVGVATFPFPSGSIVLIGVGCGLLGWGINVLLKFKHSFENYIRYKINKRKYR